MDVKVHDRYPEGTTSKQRYVIKRRTDNFIIKDGELHYICRRKKNRSEHLAKVITTAEEANSVFVEFHCSGIGGHFGVEKTHSAIITRYYWPAIQEDIRKWIAQCPECQAKRAIIKEKREYEPIQLDLSKHDVAAGAVCHNRHWTLIIMYLKERRSLFGDPFGATDQQLQHCKTVTRKRDQDHNWILKRVENIDERRLEVQQRLLQGGDEYSRFGQTVADMIKRLPEDRRSDVMCEVYIHTREKNLIHTREKN
ncbi:uncharacterized protein LOC117534630 isoform X4 [Scomber scombrus]|uniref:Gypsy retrotransposon integrase-like protein 1 n=1 Tax=Scomber scombrus TaxID=13677 RepID=A0AAV1PFB0_SCOSC